MSLTPKRRMTAKSLAAHRSNAVKSRGAVTKAGKARSAAARLRYGIFSRRDDEPIAEFGEDPKEYAALLKSLVRELQPCGGLQSELVLGMRRALWRMRRAERMQDGTALRRVESGLRSQDFILGPKLMQVGKVHRSYIDLWEALKRPDYVPATAEIEDLARSCGDSPSEDVEDLISLLCAFRDAAGKEQASAQETADSASPASHGQEKTEAHAKVVAALDKLMLHQRMVLDMVMAEMNNVRSPENIAALMAPKDEEAAQALRMNDSNLRVLWRLMRLFLMIKRASPNEQLNYENPL